jgi:hypothetical protein
MATSWKRLKKQTSFAIRLVLAFAPAVWLAGRDAPGTLLGSTALLGFFLFLMPRHCGAIRSNGTRCTNNALGFLGGCHFLQHKWQNAWRLVPTRLRPPSARPDLVIVRGRQVVVDTGLWGSPGQIVTTLGSVSSALGVVVSFLAWRFPVN